MSGEWCISVCDVCMRCMKCVLCLIDLCIISAQSHARAPGIKHVHQKQRMLEGDIKLFAGLFHDMHNVLCLQCTHTDGMVVVVKSTKTLKSVVLFGNRINLFDMQCLCRAFHVSVMMCLDLI